MSDRVKKSIDKEVREGDEVIGLRPALYKAAGKEGVKFSIKYNDEKRGRNQLRRVSEVVKSRMDEALS